METKKFKMRDESFTCEYCHQEIKPLGYTARDHCPYCLYSKHVDNNPGDRANNCQGLLKPIAIDNAPKGKYKIVYQCTKCNTKKRNITATDDNQDIILNLMNNIFIQ